MNPPHKQPVAVVTGASAGIGLAIARSLARDGAALVLTARNEDRLIAAAQAIVDDTGAPVLPIVADAANPADMEALIAAALEQFGRIDVLVNNAGIADTVPISESSSASFLEFYITNVFGPAAAIRAAWPVFLHQGSGRVINISSWAARDPFPGFFIYGSSKAALNGLTRSINVEGAQHNVRAFSICPGAVETDLLRAVVDETQCPPDACLDPQDIADLAMACLNGDHDDAPSDEIYIKRGPSGAVEIDIPHTVNG